MKNRYIKISLLVTMSVLFSSFSLYADNSSELLRDTIVSAQNRISGQSYKPFNNGLDGIDAWIDKSEIKWNNSDLGDFEDQKLSYEIQLKNRAQINTEQALLNIGQTKATLKQSNYLKQKLNYRYLSIIDLIEKTKQQNLLQRKHKLVNSELSSWKLKINSDTFRADKLQQADLSLDNVWGEMLENGDSLERLRTNTGDSHRGVVNNTLAINQILRTVSDILQTGEYQQYNGKIQKAEMDILYANKQQQRRVAQRKLSLSSFKLEYDNKDDDFGVSVGIRTPITKNSFDSLQEKQALHYTNLDAQNIRFEIEDQLIEKKNQLLQLQNQWLSSQKVVQKVKVRIARLATTNNIDLLLALKTQHLGLLKRQNSLQVQSLRQYVSFLNIAGMLSAKPYKNWLLAGTPRLF